MLSINVFFVIARVSMSCILTESSEAQWFHRDSHRISHAGVLAHAVWRVFLDLSGWGFARRDLCDAGVDCGGGVLFIAVLMSKRRVRICKVVKFSKSISFQRCSLSNGRHRAWQKSEVERIAHSLLRNMPWLRDDVLAFISVQKEELCTKTFVFL